MRKKEREKIEEQERWREGKRGRKGRRGRRRRTRKPKVALSFVASLDEFSPLTAQQAEHLPDQWLSFTEKKVGDGKGQPGATSRRHTLRSQNSRIMLRV